MFIKKYVDLPKNLLGLLFWNIFGIYMVIFIVLGLLSLFGVKSVEFNGEETYGFLGLIVCLVMAPLMAFVTSFATWILLIVGNFVLKTLANRSSK